MFILSARYLRWVILMAAASVALADVESESKAALCAPGVTEATARRLAVFEFRRVDSLSAPRSAEEHRKHDVDGGSQAHGEREPSVGHGQPVEAGTSGRRAVTGIRQSEGCHGVDPGRPGQPAQGQAWLALTYVAVPEIKSEEDAKHLQSLEGYLPNPEKSPSEYERLLRTVDPLFRERLVWLMLLQLKKQTESGFFLPFGFTAMPRAVAQSSWWRRSRHGR